MKVLWDLFIGFFRPGLFGYGGGPSMIPLIQNEVVETYGWLTREEFIDALALGNSLPGPIATKLAALVGFKVAGELGAAVALVGVVFPSVILILLLTGVYLKFKNSSKVEGMLKAVRPVVVILLAQITWSMGLNSFSNTQNVVIGGLSLIGLTVYKIHPSILIIAALAFGFIVG